MPDTLPGAREIVKNKADVLKPTMYTFNKHLLEVNKIRHGGMTCWNNTHPTVYLWHESGARSINGILEVR